MDVVATRKRKPTKIPESCDSATSWWKSSEHLIWVLVLVGFTLMCGLALRYIYLTMSQDHEITDKITVYGINDEALAISAYWAMWTLLVWIVLFIGIDRFRSHRWAVWYISLGWGVCIATYISLILNSWAAGKMVQNKISNAASAVFVAPFVEEASKASILFILVIFLRYQLVSKLNLISLSGLSAAGFAFTENILYYGRGYVEATHVIDKGNPKDNLMQLVWARGVITAFAHPLFTMMTALGICIALRTRSKIVRVTAPLCGFVSAAGLHMTFNGLLSTLANNYMTLVFIIAIVAVAIILALLISSLIIEEKRIRAKLFDFVYMGWLEPSDPEIYSRVRSRAKLVTASIFQGPKIFMNTIKFMRLITELAYLRDSETRGLVAGCEVAKEKKILELLKKLRGSALTNFDSNRMAVTATTHKNRMVK